MTDTMRTKSGYAVRPLELYEKSRHEAKVYRFVFKGYCSGWVIFTICDETGELSVQSDWGCWGHRWNTDHLGNGATLTEFIRDMSDTWYLANKLSYSMPLHERTIPNIEATEKNIKKRIIDCRRHGEIDAEQAREVWEDAEDLMATYAESGFDIAYYNMSHELSDVLGDGWEYFETDENPNLVILRERLLPFLIEELKGEVDGVEG